MSVSNRAPKAKRIAISLAAMLFLTSNSLPVALSQSDQKPAPAEILSMTADNGRRLLDALREYTYYAELTIQTVSQADTITGQLYRFSLVSFDRGGNRQEKILENTSTLPKDVYIGTNAANNLTRVYSFIITPETLNQYEFNYVGRERIDELNTYVFDVKPKVKMPDPEKSAERFLKGRVWIDDQDLCVVKVSGEALPEQSAHRTPRFETYFQNYGKFWFPAYVSADDQIRMGKYFNRVIVKVRFTSYKKATAQG
ncbi:MAG TPA: hypothetical protein VNN73_01640 [Blastocatellia bacterium]|nr:hypothetical protein [Blastocatellia bacterium]